MKYLATSLFVFLLPSLSLAAGSVSVQPASSTPSQMVKQSQLRDPAMTVRPSWESTPEENSQRYLAIVQDKLGKLGTLEAEEQAKAEIEAQEIVRMQQIINDQERDINKLRMRKK